jgi:hypothetical protein
MRIDSAMLIPDVRGDASAMRHRIRAEIKKDFSAYEECHGRRGDEENQIAVSD